MSAPAGCRGILISDQSCSFLQDRNVLYLYFNILCGFVSITIP